MGKHLVFYDGECGLCDRVVTFLLWADKDRRFCFSPLQGETAHRLVPEYTTQLDTLVLIENYESQIPSLYVMSKAVFRILWLLGGLWKLLGWMFILPSWMADWAYKLVARNRHHLFNKESCRIITKEDDRFLN